MTLTIINDAEVVGGITMIRTFIQLFPVGFFSAGVGIGLGADSRGTTYDTPTLIVQAISRTSVDAETAQEYDPAKYSNILAIYFEALIGIGNAGRTMLVEVYNVTDSVAITGTELSSTSTVTERKRTDDIKANMPTTAKMLSLRVKHITDVGICSRAQIIIDQGV